MTNPIHIDISAQLTLLSEIKREVDAMEERLWETAEKYYQLERTQESAVRVRKTINSILTLDLLERGLDGLPPHDAEPFDPINPILAISFLGIAIAQRENEADAMIRALASAAEACGIALTIGIRKANPNKNPYKKLQAEMLSALGRKAARIRHAESYQIAERLEQWYLENYAQYKSLDKAAEAATKIEPVSFRTARKHIGNAAKKLRSARKE